MHRSNNELVEINKDVDESKEDANNGTNDDNGLLGNSDEYDCNQITGYENDQWIVEHMLEGVSSSNAKLHLWEFLICSNQHSVLPWSMITNSTSRGGKKAPPWQPRLLQVFQTGLMNAKKSNTWKTKYQAVITYKIYHQMATVRWMTWKFEMTVNDLRPVLSLIDTQDRKQKDRCHLSNIAPPDKFSVGPGTKSTSKNKINSAKCHKPKLFESGSRIVLQDNHVTLLDAIGLNWKTKLVTHYIGTLEASQHIYIQLMRPNSNECSNSNFAMTFPESTYLTMTATHVFTPPNKPSKRGKLLETVADRYLPAPQIQHSEHRVSFMLLLASLMSVSSSSDLQLDLSVTHIRAASKHGSSISRQWTSNDCLSGILGVDPQGRFVVIPHKKHCHITLQVSTVHHDQADVLYVEEREWCIKETATAALTKKTHNMSSKSRYKPRFKGAVASIKGTSQHLWSKSERYLDEELYHCTWNSKITDNKQSNTESEGVSEYGKTISNHSQHWKRENDLDEDLYDAITCTKHSRQHQATRMSNKVTWLLREPQLEEVIKTRLSFVHPSSLVRIFEDYQSAQSVIAIQVRIIGPPSVGCSFVHLSFLDRIFGVSHSAQSVFAIQVRIIGPLSAGVTNSVLFTNKTMEEYKIQLP